MDTFKRILTEEGELKEQTTIVLKQALDYKNKYLSNKHGDLFLGVDLLI